MITGDKNPSAKQYKKLRKLVITRKIISAVAGFIIIAGIVIYLALPAIIEHIVLPRITEKLGITYFSANVRNINFNSFDLAEVHIGKSPGGDQLALSSVRIDYKLSLHNFEITRIVVSGLKLDVKIDNNNNIFIAGRSLEEWQALIPASSGQDTEVDKTKSSYFHINEVALEFASLHLATPGYEWQFPIEARLVMPTANRQQMNGELKIFQGRDYITGNFAYSRESRKGNFNAKLGIFPQRYLALFPTTANLPISGGIGAELNAEIDGATMTASGTAAFNSRNFKYDKLNLSPDMIFNFTLHDRKLSFNSVEGCLGVNGYGIQSGTDHLKGDMDFRGKTAAVEWQSSIAFQGIELYCHPVLQLNFADGFDITGNYTVTDNKVNQTTPLSGEITFHKHNDNLNAALSFASEQDYAMQIPVNDAQTFRLFNLSGNAEISHSKIDTQASLAVVSDKWDLVKSAQEAAASLNLSGAQTELKVNYNTGNPQAVASQLTLNNITMSSGKQSGNIRQLHINAATDSKFNFTGADLLVNDVMFSMLPFKITDVKFHLPWNKLAADQAVQSPWHINTDTDISVTGTVEPIDGGYHISGAINNPVMTTAPQIAVNAILWPKMQIHTELHVPEQLPDMELVHQLFPVVQAWNIGGLIKLDANYDYGFGANGGAAILGIRDGYIEQQEIGLSIEDIETELSLSNLPNLNTDGKQELHCAKISYGGMEFNNLYVGFQIAEQELFIDEVDVEWCGGHIYSYALRLNKNSENINATVFCDGLLLSEFINTFGYGRASGSGKLYGRIPISYGPDGIFMKRGFLYSEPGVPEQFSLMDMESALGFDPASVTELDIAAQALKDFIYDWVKVDFITEDENLQLALTFNGRPADTLPFTFDAQKGGFVRVDYKGANFQGINLTLNWIIPLNKILELKAQTQKLMKGVKL